MILKVTLCMSRKLLKNVEETGLMHFASIFEGMCNCRMANELLVTIFTEKKN